MNAERLKVIAYNAICMWQEDSYDSYDEDRFKNVAMHVLGITEEEYREIMED